jgi:hypothetical protein
MIPTLRRRDSFGHEAVVPSAAARAIAKDETEEQGRRISARLLTSALQ